MNIKKELIKAGFEDQTEYAGSYTDVLRFELCYDLPQTKTGKGNIRIRAFEDTEDFEITVMDGDGYEILIGMVGNNEN